MSLIDCRECGKQVSSSATKCPECGIKTPSKKKHNISKVSLFIILISIVLLVAIIAASIEDIPPIDEQAERVSKEFLNNNPELGELTFPYIEDTAPWAHGKRQWVTTGKGTFLFYLKGGEVVTVYMSDKNEDGGRREIWRKPKDDTDLTDTSTTNEDLTVVKWSSYQPTLKQDIDKMAEEKNCDVLKKFFDNAFELQQSEYGHAPLVVYITGKRGDAGCQK